MTNTTRLCKDCAHKTSPNIFVMYCGHHSMTEYSPVFGGTVLKYDDHRGTCEYVRKCHSGVDCCGREGIFYEHSRMRRIKDAILKVFWR